MIGSTISRYKILEKLGQGGMGEVFLALDTSLDRKVALKFLSGELQSDPKARRRFLQEARSAAILDHPFICKIYEAAEVDGVFFIAMEYIEGETLRDRLGAGLLPLPQVIQLVTEVAEALETAHEKRIAHRDLKPSNIMLSRGGHVKVMDFGLAKRLDPLLRSDGSDSTVEYLTSPGTIVGTLDYMSPEQVRGLETDARSDIFSLGVILYEMLTGVHPFRRESAIDTGSAILHATPDPLSSYRSAVPPALASILRRMLARNVEERYPSTGDLLARLRAIPSDEGSGRSRRLAVIMFTDIVGYSALAQRNEELALQLLGEHRGLLRALFPGHGGEEIKTIGDAFMVEFASALEATRCAVAIQRMLFDRNASLPDESHIRLRIGLHLGDVVHKEDDIFGDGVNIAARIEPMAEPGGICVSEDIANQISNKIDLPLHELPDQPLKNIERPVRIFALGLPWSEPPVSRPSDGGSAGSYVSRTGARAGAPGKAPAGSLRRWAVSLALLVAVAAATLAGWWILTPRTKAFGFQERDWIVVCDFENQTGEAVFDKSLDTALRVSITQSSYVNVVPRSRLGEVLRRMQKGDVSRIDEPIGREIAQREGIKAVLVPSITGVAGTYNISAVIEDPATGAAFSSETIRVREKEEVLNALDELARKTRRILGESIGAIARQGKELVEVTTPSLEALKQYSIAIEKHGLGNFGEARTYYENALAIDPKFTAAKASLGMIHVEAHQARNYGVTRFEGIDRELGKKLLSEAALNTNNLTDRERYGILAFYARAVDNDLPKAIQYLNILAGMYPDDATVHNNLGWFLRQTRRGDEAAAEFKEAIRIDPTLMLSYDGLLSVYLYDLGEVSQAVELCRQQIAGNAEHYQAYDNLGWAYLGNGELEGAREAFAKAIELNPRVILYRFRLAHTYRLLGKYARALECVEEISEADDAGIHYQRGVLRQLLDDKQGARRHFELQRVLDEKRLKANPGTAFNHINLALTLARLGETRKAEASLKSALAIDPADHFGSSRVHCVLGKTEESLDELEEAIRKGLTNYIWVKIHPDLEGIYRHPRFKALLARVLE